MTNPEFDSNPETENIELVLSRLRDMAQGLEYISSSEMESLASDLNRENLTEVLKRWRPMAENLAEQKSGEFWLKAQIALLLEEARLILKSGMTEQFIQSLDDAIEYASQIDLEDVAKELQALSSNFKK